MTARDLQRSGYWPTAKTRELLHGTSVSEAEFMATVVDAAEKLGWLCYHTYDSRRSTAGFPDLVLARAGEVIFAELKSAKGTTTREQEQWLLTLSSVKHVAAVVWRPQELDDILERLKPKGRTR
jgi:hypothetical protein